MDFSKSKKISSTSISFSFSYLLAYSFKPTQLSKFVRFKTYFSCPYSKIMSIKALYSLAQGNDNPLCLLFYYRNHLLYYYCILYYYQQHHFLVFESYINLLQFHSGLLVLYLMKHDQIV